MATTAQALAVVLDKRAAVQQSEGFEPDFLSGLVNSALVEHNPTLSFSTLPVNQEEMVILLAWIKLTVIRAGKVAQDTNLSGTQGFAQDRSTPFSKLMAFATRLQERYDALGKKLGIDSSPESSSLKVSSLRISDEVRAGQSLPTYAPPTPATPVLTLVETPDGGTSAVLSWTYENLPQFHSFILLGIEDSEATPIYQEWNFNSLSTVPKTQDASFIVGTLYVQGLRSVKITDIDRTKHNRFILVVRSHSDTYSYSNEVTLAALP